MGFQKIIAISILLLFQTLAFNQNDHSAIDPDLIAKEHINALKEGYLTVVLPSEMRKLNELHKLSESESLSVAERERFKNEYDEVLTSRNAHNEAFIKAMKENFQFCDFQFIYDFQLRTEAPEVNYAEADPFEHKQIEGPEYRLRFGKTKEAEHFGIEAIVITDSKGKDLSRPFPYYVSLNKRTWLNGIISIFHPEGYGQKPPEELVAQLQSNLSYFYIEEKL